MQNRFDMPEFAGAFGDLGTLIPFVVAYISVLDMDPCGILSTSGVALILAGLVFKTPFPVQPMKAIGAAAVSQAVGGIAVTSAMVTGAGLVTGLIWVALAVTGMAKRIAAWVPRPALLGVVMGLGLSFMLHGIGMMAEDWLVAPVLLFVTLVLLGRFRIPPMLVLLLLGVVVTLLRQPSLAGDLASIEPSFRLPTPAWPTLDWHDVWMGAVLLALPQLPLTFGNAVVAITDENNRLFPDRPVTEGRVAFSTGLMNLCSSALGGIPMCHGAGGMAGHVRFGARTGGASIMLGVLLTTLGLLFGDFVATLFGLLPPAVLGIILFLAGTELALGSYDFGSTRADRFIVLATAAFATSNVGVAMLFGLLACRTASRGWLKP